METRVCSICGARCHARGWCKKHYNHWYVHGDPEFRMKPKAVCSICGNKHYGRGWCKKHYMRWYTHGDPEFMLRPRNPGAICRIPGCGRPHCAKGLCSPHWQRVRRVGSLLHYEMGYEIREYGG